MLYRLRALSLVVVLCTAAAPAAAQEGGLDQAALRAVYGVEAPVFVGAMRGVDATAYPVFVTAPAMGWGSAWLVPGVDRGDAYRLTVAEAAAFVAAGGLKQLVRRPRPYAVLDDVRSRAGTLDQAVLGQDSHAFPSGHATLAFAVAASWSLSHPDWYVVAPSLLWASGVSLSRVWMGVHYPSDVLAGALLGSAVAWGVHRVRDAITPGGFEEDEDAAASAPLLVLRFRL